MTHDGAIPQNKRIIGQVWASHSKTKESLFFIYDTAHTLGMMS